MVFQRYLKTPGSFKIKKQHDFVFEDGDLLIATFYGQPYKKVSILKKKPASVKSISEELSVKTRLRESCIFDLDVVEKLGFRCWKLGFNVPFPTQQLNWNADLRKGILIHPKPFSIRDAETNPGKYGPSTIFFSQFMELTKFFFLSFAKNID